MVKSGKTNGLDIGEVKGQWGLGTKGNELEKEEVYQNDHS